MLIWKRILSEENICEILEGLWLKGGPGVWGPRVEGDPGQWRIRGDLVKGSPIEGSR